MKLIIHKVFLVAMVIWFVFLFFFLFVSFSLFKFDHTLSPSFGWKYRTDDSISSVGRIAIQSFCVPQCEYSNMVSGNCYLLFNFIFDLASESQLLLVSLASVLLLGLWITSHFIAVGQSNSRLISALTFVFVLSNILTIIIYKETFIQTGTRNWKSSLTVTWLAFSMCTKLHVLIHR